MDLKQIMEFDELLLESARRKYRASTHSMSELIGIMKGGKMEPLDDIPRTMTDDIRQEDITALFSEGWSAFSLIVRDLVDVCKSQNILDSQQQILLALALYRRKMSGDINK
jgi:hypothetical protein